jgi:hypothetical protein
MSAPLPERGTFTTTDLIAWRTRQLQKHTKDLTAIKEKVLKARYSSIHDFKKCFHASIKDYDFAPGALVLVQNSKVEYKLSKKTKPRYLGPMVVVRRMKGGSYILAELDGTISKLQFATFRIIPYSARNPARIAVTSVTGMNDTELDRIANEDNIEPEEEEPEDALDV